MSSLLFRNRLRCFYCGDHSRKRKINNNARSWTCEHCLAVNHFNENGEFIDVPLEEANRERTPVQFAKPIASQVPPDSSSLFCAKCRQNQTFTVSLLSSYLPSPSHPDYPQYEAAYPEYRKNLDRLYPPVCPKCEPRVRERIQESIYFAKSDHLRLSMDRARTKRLERRKRFVDWISLLCSMGALAFWLSVAGQVTGNAINALPTEASPLGGLQDDPICNRPTFTMTPMCLVDAATYRHVSGECSALFIRYIQYALVLGVVSSWWNPMFKIRRSNAVDEERSIIGLKDYYVTQLTTLMTRILAWFLLRRFDLSSLHPRLPMAINTVVAIITILSIPISRRGLKLKDLLVIPWNDELEPLTSPTSQETLPTPQLPNPPSLPHTGSFSTAFGPSRFPLEKLVSSSPPSSEEIINKYRRNEPSTPSVSDDEVEEMDWTPSGPPTQLFVSSNQPTYPMNNSNFPKQPMNYSAFSSKVPAVPRPPAWRLHSPMPDSKAKPVQSARPNPFKNTPKSLFTSSTGAELSPETPVMANPKFFPPEDFAETGLETLFGRAFKVSDDSETKNPEHNQVAGSTERSSSRLLPVFPLQTVLVTGLLVLLIAVLCGVLLLPTASWGPRIWKTLEQFRFPK